jgi:hypothetical protein
MATNWSRELDIVAFCAVREGKQRTKTETTQIMNTFLENYTPSPEEVQAMDNAVAKATGKR